jgi:hypothetical protein
MHINTMDYLVINYTDIKSLSEARVFDLTSHFPERMKTLL